ncbi:MAG: CsgG/HfaB family protein [Candidatus Zixiibacteriota bacterium]
MLKSIVITGALCICLLCLLGTTYTAASDIEDNLTYQGNKARVGVGNIKAKADQCTHDMAASIGEMLSTALVNTGKFIVLASQEETAELIEEIDFGGSGYTEEGRSPEKGLMEGADLLVTGAVTTFEPDAGGGGGGLGGLKKKAFGKVGMSSKTAKIAFELKLIDIRTRRILKAKTIKAESKHWKADMAGGGWTKDVALAGGLGIYSNEPMEEAIRAVLAETVETISKEVPAEYYRYQGQGQYTQQYGNQQQQGGGSGASQQAAPPPASSQGGAGATGSVVAAPAAEDMALYTKYDFVPGDKVIFYDDLKDEEESEFPYRWNLDHGVFEIARLGKDFWILCTDAGSIRPKLPDAPLPEQYTVELEFYIGDPEGSMSYHRIHWVDANGKNIGNFGTVNKSTWLDIGNKQLASKSLDKRPAKGVHTLRIMATSRSVKCFFDEERVANVPKVENFHPVGFRVNLDPTSNKGNPCLIRNFRFAEGGKSMREQLDATGKVVTHGILFDVDSYTIKGESFKTLRDISRLLEDDPELRLSIEGHTDSDGDDAHNMELSKMRAKSVCDYLIQTYSINAGRLEAKGWGESKPIDTNGSAEGKANNRRVELVKL